MTKVITIKADKLAEKIAEAAIGEFIPTLIKKITKAKFNKAGGVDVDFESIATIIDPNTGKPVELISDDGKKGRYFAHQDLVDAFTMLRSHMAFICDLPEARGLTLHELEDDDDLLEKIKITGMSLGGDGEHEGVTIIGMKILNSGKVLNLVAPFTKFVDENQPYLYGDELCHITDHVSHEVLAYVEGKYAPSAQQELDFENSSDEELE